jgi:hypothetical protein
VVETDPNEIWEADQWEGLIKLSARKDKSLFNPNGVFSTSFYKLSVFNDDIYVAAGAELGYIAAFNSGGISKFSKGTWSWYNRFVGTPGMDTVIDIVDVAVDKRNKNIYAASYGGGLLEIHPDNTTTTYKENGFIQSQIGNPGANIIFNIAFDDQNNLWMSNYSAPNQLVVKKADGSPKQTCKTIKTHKKVEGDKVPDTAKKK